MKLFKKSFLLSCVATISLSLFAAPTSLLGRSDALATVKVGSKTQTITRAELDAKKAQYEKAGVKNTEEEVLDTLINDKVFLMNAEQDGIKITEAEIDDQIKQARSKLEESAGQSVTDEELEQLVQKQYDMSMSELRESLKNQAILSKYLQMKRPNEINKTFTVTNSEIETYYKKNKSTFVSPEAVKLSHIYKKESKSAMENDANRKQLQDVLSDIKKGKITFEAAVQEYSDVDSANSKAQGGAIGWIGYSYSDLMGDEFVNAAMELKPGEISSSVVHSPLGYHIIKVTATQPQKFLTLDDYTSPESSRKVRDYIKQNLEDKKQQDNIVDVTNSLVDELVKKAKITNNLKK